MRLRPILVLLLLLTPLACGDSTGGSRREPAEVRLNSPTLVLNDGATGQLSATVLDEDGEPMTGVAVRWESTDDAVASVSQSGVVTGNHPGVAFIRAVAGTLSAQAQVDVHPVATRLLVEGGQDQQGAAGAHLGVGVRVVDRHGNGVAGVTVTFAVVSGGGAILPATAFTPPDGRIVASWRLGPGAGPQRASATAAGLTGSPAELRATAVAGAPANVTRTGGDAQTGTVGQQLALPVSVRVTDQYGNPVAGVALTWMAGLGGSVTPPTSVTDANGNASASWTLGSQAGPQQLGVVAGGMAPIFFSATGTAAAPATLTVVGGNHQQGAVGEALGAPLAVRVADVHGNPVPGAAVAWTAVSGGGSLPASSTTDPVGVAMATWTLGTQLGAQQAAASVNGLSAAFTATAQAGAPASLVIVSGDGQTGTAGEQLAQPLRVRVTDAYGHPVEDAYVGWGSSVGTGAPVPNEPDTDANGYHSITWFLGPEVVTQKMDAMVNGLRVVFTATATAP